MGCCLAMAMLVAEILVLRDRLRAIRGALAWRLALRRTAGPAGAVAITCVVALAAIEHDAPVIRAVWHGAGVQAALSLCRGGALPSWLAAL